MTHKAAKTGPGAMVLVAVEQYFPQSTRIINDNVADILGAYGWRILEHLGYKELAEQYVKPTGRSLLSMAIERIVYADKT